MVSASRLSYQLFVKEIPQGLCVLHHCDNPSCVNPKHLWLGTVADNTRDMLNKGRERLRGSDNGRSKLTESQVKKIRLLYPKILTPVLAKMFKISEDEAYLIVVRKRWAHV